MKARRIDHIGINVQNLTAAKDFFLDLGFEVLGEMDVEGEWVGQIIGLNNVKDSIVMLGLPDTETKIELVQFHTPLDDEGIKISAANTLGIRHFTLEVENIDTLVTNLQGKGHELIGELYTYENLYRLCYIRGPEGIILELAEPLKGN